MAASLPGVIEAECEEKINSSKILVVGAGGIGCELLKNLVLTGFKDIELIDLDTIDVSNLNRQFLFRKEHVGMSKAKVAKESALQFNPDANIVAYHDSIFSTEYGLDFFKKFNVVMNALDNTAARNHVNRMCLAADVPLIESGSAGYLGQVTVIKKGLTECYECQPKPPQKSYPGCTIRNTPSEPIHCIVWAKHLFNQLYGQEDPDQDVSPDTEDPELAGDAGQTALAQEAKENTIGGIERKSTKAWAMEIGYEPHKIFNKLFHNDIKYLLSMDKLWKKRRPPICLHWDSLPDTVEASDSGVIHDQRLWSIKECAEIFGKCLGGLKEQLSEQGDGGMLVWDKDDDLAMDFVTSAANIRAHIFGIPSKTRFDIKSMAGNIIPAIATTNAIIAALIVMEGLKVLKGQIEKCKSVFLNRQPNFRKKLLVPCPLEKRNPKCYVCSLKPEVTVVLNTNNFTVKGLEEKVIKKQLNMVAPDVEIDDGKGTILISSEEGETEGNAEKFLSDFNIANGTRLKCDDFLQNYNLVITIVHREKLEEDQEFSVVGDLDELLPKEESEKSSNGNAENKEDDDSMIVEETPDDGVPVTGQRKRKADNETLSPIALKKARLSSEAVQEVVDVDEVEIL